MIHANRPKKQKIVSRQTLLPYPDFNEPFEIHTDARKIQLWAVNYKKGKPIVLFYSRKLKYRLKKVRNGSQLAIGAVAVYQSFLVSFPVIRNFSRLSRMLTYFSDDDLRFLWDFFEVYLLSEG